MPLSHRRKRRHFADPEAKRMYEESMEQLKEQNRRKEAEEEKKRLERHQQEERQRELQEDRLRQQRLRQHQQLQQDIVSPSASSRHTGRSNNYQQQSAGKTPKLFLSKQQDNSNTQDINVNIASPISSVSMSQSQSQSQHALPLGCTRRQLSSNDEKNHDSNMMLDRKPPSPPSAAAAAAATATTTTKLASTRKFTAPKVKFRKRVPVESSSDDSSSSDNDKEELELEDENSKRKLPHTPGIQNRFLELAANITTKKRSVVCLDSSDNDSSSDEDINRILQKKPSLALLKKKRQTPPQETQKDHPQHQQEMQPEQQEEFFTSVDPKSPQTQSMRNGEKKILPESAGQHDFLVNDNDDSPPAFNDETNKKMVPLPKTDNNCTIPKQGKSRLVNPIAMEKAEREQNEALLKQLQEQSSSKEYRMEQNQQDDLLWEDDFDEVPIIKTARTSLKSRRRDTGQKALVQKAAAASPASAFDSAREAQQSATSDPVMKFSTTTSPPVGDDDDDDDDDDDENMDAETKAMRNKQHPEFANPHFGPFANEPFVLQNLKTGDVGPHQVPASLSRYLPVYQREGIQFLYNNIVNGLGVILGDDMGLGKTVQVIAVISALLGKTGTGRDHIVLEKRKRNIREFKRELQKLQMDSWLGIASFKSKDERLREFKESLALPAKLPILLIVPASVLDNWAYEFELWGHFFVVMYRDSERDDALEAIEFSQAEVMVMGHTLFGKPEHFARLNEIPWKLCVIDEFHVFKSPTAYMSKHLKKLSLTHKDCQLVGMTGTVMQNRFEEFHNLVDLIDDNRLGKLKPFMKRFGEPIKLSRTANASKNAQEYGERKRQEFQALYTPIYIKRLKTEVLKELPLKTENVLLCELSDMQKDVYDHILNLPDYLLLRGANAPCDCGVNMNYFAEYRRLRSAAEKIEYQRKNHFKKRKECCYSSPPPGEEKAVLWRHQHADSNYEECKKCPTCILLPALTMLYKLSSSIALLQYNKADKRLDKESKEKQEAFAKIAFPKDVIRKLPGKSFERCDSALLNEDHFAMSGKMKKLHKLLMKIQKNGERVLLFSYSTQTLDVIQNYMESQSYRFLRIDGSTPAKDRQGLVNEFQTKDSIFCFLLSTRAAGVGLNLTAANQVIIFDCEWNPANDEQAQDRSFRIGQKKDVTVHRLIAQGTIDELKYLRQIYKLHLKQEAFRSEGSGNKAAPRSFLGVERDTKRKGELFGMENLLNFSKESAFMEKVWKTKKKSSKKVDTDGLTGLNSIELAEDWGSDGEKILNGESESWISKQIAEQAGTTAPEDVPSIDKDEDSDGDSDVSDCGDVRTNAKTFYKSKVSAATNVAAAPAIAIAATTSTASKRTQQSAEATELCKSKFKNADEAAPGTGVSCCKAVTATAIDVSKANKRKDAKRLEDEEEDAPDDMELSQTQRTFAFDHNAFLNQDEVKTRYDDPNNVMVTENEITDRYISGAADAKKDESAENAESAEEAEGADEDDSSDASMFDDAADIIKEQTTPVKSKEEKLLERARLIALRRTDVNLALCSGPVKDRKTEFSVDDIYQPKRKMGGG